jgi:hypothetical protein
MRKFALPAVLVLALVLPAQASAKVKRYTGMISPAGAIGFKVVQKKRSKKKRVTAFSFSGVPLICQEGARTAGGVVSSPVPLKKNGRFNLVASNPITQARLEIHGSLATGTIQLSGNVAIEPTGTGTSCQSGVLAWTAHRG